MITGRALQVLPRLSDAGYDLVVIDAVTTEYPRYLAEALRLLRPGGVVVLDNVLWNGRVADPCAARPWPARCARPPAPSGRTNACSR